MDVLRVPGLGCKSQGETLGVAASLDLPTSHDHWVLRCASVGKC